MNIQYTLTLKDPQQNARILRPIFKGWHAAYGDHQPGGVEFLDTWDFVPRKVVITTPVCPAYQHPPYVDCGAALRLLSLLTYGEDMAARWEIGVELIPVR